MGTYPILRKMGYVPIFSMKLPENSLFAILLRARWWVSLGVAAIAFALIRLLVPTPYAAFGASPFLVIALVVLWRELRRPGAKKVAAALGRARAMSAEEFSRALEAAFRREGYSVARAGGAVDLELTHDGRVTLVACRRWKATRTGVEPLREFDAATAGRGAFSRMYVAVGEVTENARAFAKEKAIRLLHDEELARLLAR
jgi:restriction system protein